MAKHNTEDNVTYSVYDWGQGIPEIAFLKELYKRLFTDLDIGFKLVEDNFEIEGVGINELLLAEKGYHLFYRAHKNPLPIKVSLEKGRRIIDEEGTNPVIRLYDISLGTKHGASTITDLRTGFTNQANITTNEFKLFWYAYLANSLVEEKK